MNDIKMPDLFTSEMIQTAAANADALKSVMDSTTNSTPSINFKFVLCNVIIVNENSAQA